MSPKKLVIASALSLSLILLVPTSGITQAPCSLGTPYQGCKACGSALSVRVQQENVLKNRDEKAENVKVLTIAELRNPANDKSFYPNMAVQVTGYVVRVRRGGPESCNCLRRDLAMADVVITIVASPDEAGLSLSDENFLKSVIVEISPRWKEKLGIGNNPRDLVGKWVTFQGWMFYDAAHVDQAESTNPGAPGNWRATPWEIHPVTSYKILTGPP